MLERQNLNISVSQLLTYKGCQAGNKGELYQWDQTDNTGSRNTVLEQHQNQQAQWHTQQWPEH